MSRFKKYFVPVTTGKSPARGVYLILWIGAIAIFVLPWIFSISTFLPSFLGKGDVGTLIDGVSGPFIAVVAAILTFLAFFAQITANRIQIILFKDQRKQFDIQLEKNRIERTEQEKIWRIERFENKFYELVRLHKENLHDVSIGGYDGKKIEHRKAFVSMYKELRFAFIVTKQTYSVFREHHLLNEDYDDKMLLWVAYIFFYAGVGVHSDILNKKMGPPGFDKNLYEEIRFRLGSFHRYHKTIKAKNPIVNHPDDGEAMLPKSYRPFGGHLSRLGHYYRHLFQTVAFVVDQDDDFMPKPKKLEYLKTLRAQLSDHEQVMLYYNALATFGDAWIKRNYFTEYRMIHNIPLPLASFGKSPEDEFADYINTHGEIFEWNGA